jgi:hypothetical protein
MVTLTTLRDFQAVQHLPFCYVCGREFVAGDVRDRDHVPARNLFHVNDRSPPLWLPAHKTCNGSHSANDQKIGQLIGPRWGRASRGRDRQLRFTVYGPNLAAITNINVEGIVMRWVRAFHAALYREPLLDFRHAVITPFPTAKREPFVMSINPILPQHGACVQTIKEQRALGNLDRIAANNGKLTYECVWATTDDGARWLCLFALNLYDWKGLGRTPLAPARGCAGFYTVSDRTPPEAAARRRRTSIAIPNLDQLDPFAA